MSVDGVSGIASGFGASITVKSSRATSGEVDLNRTRYGNQEGKLSAIERSGMVSWLTQSRTLHAKLEDAIRLVEGGTFGLREKETGGTAETEDLGLTTAQAAATLDSVSLFSSVTNGTLTIGGEDIAIDTSVMSFNDLVDAIGDTDHANSSFDGEQLKIVAEDGDLTITSDDTGMLSALGLTTGTTESTTFTDRPPMSGVNTYTVQPVSEDRTFQRGADDVGLQVNDVEIVTPAPAAGLGYGLGGAMILVLLLLQILTLRSGGGRR